MFSANPSFFLVPASYPGPLEKCYPWLPSTLYLNRSKVPENSYKPPGAPNRLLPVLIPRKIPGLHNEMSNILSRT